MEISSLDDKAARLADHYLPNGRFEDSIEAIQIMEQEIEMAGKHILPHMLSNLGIMLSRRFERTGSIDDLNRAVDVAEQAVNATPEDHPNRAGRLNNLENLLTTQFERTGSLYNPNRDFYVADRAVNTTPVDHLHGTPIPNCVADSLRTSLRQTDYFDEPRNVIQRVKDTIEVTPSFTTSSKASRAFRSSNTVYTSSDIPESSAYIQQLATSLFESSQLPDSKSLERVLKILPDLLQGFALGIGGEQQAQSQFEVMKFLHQKRRCDNRIVKPLYP